MLQEGERVLGGSSDLMDSREAPSYANYLALVSCYLLVYVDAASAIVYKRERVCECVRATFADVLPINRVEFQDVNLLFRCVCYVRFSDSFASALRPLAVKKRIYNPPFYGGALPPGIYIN